MQIRFTGCNALVASSRLVAVLSLLTLPLMANAVVVQYDLSFQTTGQSMWANGESTRINQTTFLGASWEDATNRAGVIVGDNDTTVPNPLRAAYDVAFAGCRAAGFSSNACINGQSARAPVPALGSRPSVRSCGTFAVGCQAARLGDLSRRAAYDVAFAACDAAFPASVCRNGQSAQVPFVALGTAPPSTLDIDTRTGAEIVATSDGRVGLELGVEIDSGSVDATVSYAATLDIPDDLTVLDRTQAISFNTNSALAGVNTLDTVFPTMALSVDAIMELSGSVTGEACLIGPGCTSGGTSFNIAERAPIVSFNEDGEGGILLLGQSPSDFGLAAEADGFPFSLDVAGLAEVTLHLPAPNATGGLNTATQTLQASGQDDLIDLILDIDNIVATSAGVPGLFGSSASFGPVSLGFDIINVAMGPTIDLAQDFELDPTLFVSMFFDEAVMVAGELVTNVTSAWDLLPDITFVSDATTVTPTFFLQSTLLNQTFLDFDLQFIVDLLQVNYDAGLLGSDSFGIGNILDQAVDLFASPAFISSLFDLGGFNLQIGESFIIDFLTGATLPSSSIAMSAINPILDLPDTASVPEPGTWVLLLSGLLGLLLAHRRRQESGRAGGAFLPVA
ncbi:MAG: PEP-CTERM sorting domain-containing protein [Pseudomonadales bacterium]|nr:PEP-CTERM sorting domain-containing protein [Pseudomonadales bacterium]